MQCSALLIRLWCKSLNPGVQGTVNPQLVLREHVVSIRISDTHSAVKNWTEVFNVPSNTCVTLLSQSSPPPSLIAVQMSDIHQIQCLAWKKPVCSLPGCGLARMDRPFGAETKNPGKKENWFFYISVRRFERRDVFMVKSVLIAGEISWMTFKISPSILNCKPLMMTAAY